MLEPEVLLYDEPTSGLDPVTSAVIGDLMVATAEDLGSTSVVVTHDLILARKVGDRLGLLDRGRFRFLGTWAEADASDDPRLRAFLRGEAPEGPDETDEDRHFHRQIERLRDQIKEDA